MSKIWHDGDKTDIGVVSAFEVMSKTWQDEVSANLLIYLNKKVFGSILRLANGSTNLA